MNNAISLSFSTIVLFSLTAGAVQAQKIKALYDGSGLSQWSMQKEGAWVSENGELQPAADKKKAGGYIWSKDKFENFTLTLEFKMSEKCNSGVFFRTDPKNAVQGGFEIQVMDTAGNSSPGKHDCGALYDAKAPSEDAAKTGR